MFDDDDDDDDVFIFDDDDGLKSDSPTKAVEEGVNASTTTPAGRITMHDS